MRRLFGCPDIVSLTEKFLMARNFYRIFTENNPVMGDSKTFGIPEAKGLSKFSVRMSLVLEWALSIQCYAHVGVGQNLISCLSPDARISSTYKISQNPLLYRIPAGQSSSGKLGGREVKTSALASRRSWVRIPPESPVKFFYRHLESTEYTVLYTRRCRAKLNQ